jgi:hypothetical protein
VCSGPIVRLEYEAILAARAADTVDGEEAA